MNLRSISRIFHPASFLLAASAVYVCSILIADRLPRLEDADALAVGVTLDLVLLVPLLYYLLLVRGAGWPAIGVAPVCLTSVLAASWILPAEHQQLLSALEWAAVPLELGLLGWIGWRAIASMRRVRRRLQDADDDAFSAIRTAARETTGSPRLAGVLAQEIAAIYYALFSWKTPLPTQGFTSYRKNSYGVFLWAIVMAVVIETVGVHLLVSTLWSSLAAWILSAIGLYGLVWLVGDFQALRLRTTSVTPDRIHVRLGTRWEVDIPRDAVTSVGPPQAPTDEATRPLDLVLLGEPDVQIELCRPVTARWVFGLARKATTIRLQIDDPEEFIERARPTV